jgi:CheY-like chemotaxis protein
MHGVLVVDDDPDVVYSVRIMLEKAGCSVLSTLRDKRTLNAFAFSIIIERS